MAPSMAAPTCSVGLQPLSAPHGPISVPGRRQHGRHHHRPYPADPTAALGVPALGRLATGQGHLHRPGERPRPPLRHGRATRHGRHADTSPSPACRGDQNTGDRRGHHISKHTGPAPAAGKQVREQHVGEQLAAVRRQEPKHVARLEQMSHYRLRIKNLSLIIRPTRSTSRSPRGIIQASPSLFRGCGNLAAHLVPRHGEWGAVRGARRLDQLCLPKTLRGKSLMQLQLFGVLGERHPCIQATRMAVATTNQDSLGDTGRLVTPSRDIPSTVSANKGSPACGERPQGCSVPAS